MRDRDRSILVDKIDSWHQESIVAHDTSKLVVETKSSEQAHNTALGATSDEDLGVVTTVSLSLDIDEGAEIPGALFDIFLTETAGGEVPVQDVEPTVDDLTASTGLRSQRGVRQHYPGVVVHW